MAENYSIWTYKKIKNYSLKDFKRYLRSLRLKMLVEGLSTVESR